MYDPPLPKSVPPDDAVYQSKVTPAVELVAVIVTVPGPHREALPAVALAGRGLIVATTAVLVAARQPVVVFLA